LASNNTPNEEVVREHAGQDGMHDRIGKVAVRKLAWLAPAVLLVASCGRGDSRAAYAPGLGEIMSLQQMRHAKLWFAGETQNWALADYELDEMEEGFSDAAKYHESHKASPISIVEAIPPIMGKPLKEMRAAIDAKDEARFVSAFDGLTAACNTCHRATDFSFNVVVRPAGNSTFVNQNFAAPAP
jgi:hypothetical protein